jgi:hypothetical protein
MRSNEARRTGDDHSRHKEKMKEEGRRENKKRKISVRVLLQPLQ